MKFRIGDSKIYDLGAIDRLSLYDILLLQEQTEAMGRAITPSDVQAMEAELSKIKDPKERGKHPHAMWIVAVGIFTSRRIAGDDISWRDAIDFPFTDLEFLPEPKDRQAKANPTQARPGSGRAGAKRAKQSQTTKTSEAPSTEG